MKVYQIELTNACNLACSYCARGYEWARRPVGFMELETVDAIEFGDTEYVELQMAGEAALHPKLEYITRMLKAKGLKVGIATNGTIFFDTAPFHLVTVTSDGHISKHRQLSGPNVFHQVLGVDHPFEDKSLVGARGFAHRSCNTPFLYVSVQWDGDVVPCAKCFGKQHVFGNVRRQTWKSIVEGDARNQFLKDMVSEVGPYLCGWCQANNPHQIHSRLLTMPEAGAV